MIPKPNTNLSQSSNSQRSNQFLQPAFSSSVALPKRRRETDSSGEQVGGINDSSESQKENDQSQSSCLRSEEMEESKEKSEEETKSLSPKITAKLSSLHSSRKQPSFQNYMFQDSDSLCNRFNLLQSEKNTHEKQLSNEERQTEPAQNQVAQQIKRERKQSIKTLQVPNQQKAPLQGGVNESTSGATQSLLQNFDKYASKEQTSYYTEWEQVFPEQKMKDLYTNYNPVHFSQIDILRIMQAIQKVSSQNICGRVFIERAYKHYVHNYGTMSQQDFETKVVGDMLFLFRKHNERQERYFQQREKFGKQQKMAKKNKHNS